MKILYHHRTRSKDGQFVHIEEMIAALRQLGHDVIVVAPPSAEIDVVEYASPLKLFDYLALSKAIIGPAQPNLMQIFNDGRNAVLFDPKAADGMAGAIRNLISDAALCQRGGENAKQAINGKQLTWRENALRAIELFKRIPSHA